MLALLSALLCLQARPDILIADFEGESYGDWRITGEAFGSRPARGALPNQMMVSGYWGKGLANSYHGGDDSNGTLTSPTFIISRKRINFLIGGGEHPTMACINLLIGGVIVATTTNSQHSEELTWNGWDVSQWEGRAARIQIVDAIEGSWGHINVDQIHQSDQSRLAGPAEKQPLYQETYRPQFHFSAKKNWLNDPNGLVYHEGEYHMFFQYTADSIHGGAKWWGHAVSPDLVHWTELPIALSPDEMGSMYSGTAALDKANTTGLGLNGKPPLIAMYTAAGNPFTQCLAYSNDRGRTWTKYAGNPVLGHVIHENRDPRIFWHEPTKKWIMALYLTGTEFAFYGSPDLKSWTELSRLNLPGSGECPEIFEIPIEGTTETRWIFYGADYHYLIGHFDGARFVPENSPIVGDHNPTFYASQVFSNAPKGRIIQVAWMRGSGPFPGMPYNQQMSFPCELKLVKTRAGLRLLRNPVQEIEKLRGRKLSETIVLEPGKPYEPKLEGGQYDLTVRLESGSITLRAADQEFILDADKRTVTGQGKTVSLGDGKAEMRLLIDRTSVELFAGNGEVSMTSYLYNGSRELPLEMVSNGDLAGKIKLEAYELASAWKS